jgi:GDPmannose 4,6-dehydratase
MYREAHGIFACSGILFNHESPRRGENFVSRKVTRGIARILAGHSDHLALGNLDTKRDWGDSRDYVEAMWLMLQAKAPDDYVIATGQARTVRDLVSTAFGLVGLDWSHYLRTDPAQIRPADVPDLRGDASKARSQLRWAPQISFETTIRDMLAADLALEGVDATKFLG